MIFPQTLTVVHTIIFRMHIIATNQPSIHPTNQSQTINNALSLDNINMIDKHKIIKYLQLQMELCVKLQNYAVIYDHAKIFKLIYL